MTSRPFNPPFHVTRAPLGEEVSTREAAALLGIHVRSIRRAIERGELHAVRRGSAYAIPVDDIVRYGMGKTRNARAPLGRRGVPPNTLPLERLPWLNSPLVGRANDILEVRTLLENPAVRLLTLTGPGGVGKTRLALASAAAISAHFPDGVAFVDLADLSRPEHVLAAIYQALGLREITGHDLRQQLYAFLREKNLLLVVDNFEHVLSAAEEIAGIAAAVPRVKLLLTSRAPLRVDGEHVLPVSPLDVPRPNEPLSVVTLLEVDATRLFIERARGHDPDFRIDAASAPLIAEICARLDGLPLAIELAATWVKLLSVPQLHSRLDKRLPLLTDRTGHDALGRHSTMRNAITWSYELLTSGDQRLYRWVAVFAGGFSLDAAEYAWKEGAAQLEHSPLPIETKSAERDDSSAIDHLDALIDHGLLIRESGPDGEPRFRMLETVREFGLEQLAAESEDLRAVHARYFAGFIEEARPYINLQVSGRVFDRLAAEDANLRLALAWLEDRGPATEFVSMVAACCVYWYVRGQVSEAERWISRALAKEDQATARDIARLMLARGEQLMVKGDYVAAENALAAGLARAQTAGDPFDIAMALFTCGVCLTFAGKADAGEASLTNALNAAETIANSSLRAAVSAAALANLSVAARSRGELALAESHSRAALHRQEEMHFDLAELRSLADLGEIAREQGNYRLAVDHYLQCIKRASWQGEKRFLADALSGLAIVAAVWEENRTALLLMGAAAALRERDGIGMLLPRDASIAGDLSNRLRDALGAEAFAAALVEGRALPESHVRALAEMIASHPAAVQPSLTRREQDVLRLIAAEQSDRQIAAELFIGLRTVHWHVRSILSKLEASSRRHAVEKARRAGMI